MMTPERFKECRKACGLSQAEWGVALGYRMKNPGAQTYMFQSGRREIPPWIERLAEMFAKHGVPPEYLVEEGKAQ